MHMIKFLKLFFAVGLVMMTFSFSVPVFAQDYGLSQTADASGLNNYPTSVPEIVGNVIGTALSLIAVIFFALMIFGGFLWMTAHGKEDQEKKALDTIIAATIGIIIILASYAITSFVFKSVGGSNQAAGTVIQPGDSCDVQKKKVGEMCAALSDEGSCLTNTNCKFDATLGCVSDYSC